MWRTDLQASVGGGGDSCDKSLHMSFRSIKTLECPCESGTGSQGRLLEVTEGQTVAVYLFKGALYI